METTKTHWRKLQNPDYIGSYTLMETGKAIDMIICIRHVEKKEVKGVDGKKEMCTVATLYDQKPFIINATNSKMLSKLFKSPYVEDWYNKPFTIYVAQVRVAGETVDALRIRSELPKVAPPASTNNSTPIVLQELTPAHEKWQACKEAIGTGQYDLDDIKKKYTISEENQKLLIAA